MQKDTEKENLEKEMQEFEKQKLLFEAEKRALEQQKKSIKPDIEKVESDFDMMKPVMARKSIRINKILELSRAKNQKIMRGRVPHWTTIPPKMHISGLEASMSNGIVKITYQKYKMDNKGNKVIKEHKGIVKAPDGTDREVVLSANYIFDCFIVETIADKKPIQIEEFKEDN